MSIAAIRMEHVVRRFGDLTAVDGVTLEVHPGEVFGILGHNGAGKTTLIRLVTGLLRPHEGTITTLGHDPISEGEAVRRRAGVLTEYPALDAFLSPRENLSVYASIHGLEPAAAAARCNDLLLRLGLENHRDVPSHSLSAGLKQRVALARALIHDPELLLLDEPTSNLDPLAARGVRELVLELARERGNTVLLSTHNLTEAQQLCDRIAIIQQGRLLAIGSLEELRSDVSVGEVAVRVEPGEGHLAVAALAGVPGVEVLTCTHDTELEIRATPGQVPEVVAAIARAGLRIHEVRPEAPTLEDVYISLHDRGRDLAPSDVEVA